MNNGFRLALFASVALVGGLVLLLRGGDVGRSAESLTIYYASGVRRPVEEIIAAYGREYSVEIQTQSADKRVDEVGYGREHDRLADGRHDAAWDEGLMAILARPL